MPEEFVTYIKLVREMSFEEKPDYKGLRKLFKDLLYRNELEYDYNFDWLVKQRRDKLKRLKNSPQKLTENQHKTVATVGDVRANYINM